MIPALAKTWNPPAKRLHGVGFPIVAITGGIASGKSTLTHFFESRGVFTLSADTLIKKIYTWPQTIDWLKKRHPDVVKEGKPDFALLREKVFSDTNAKAELEAILYPGLPKAFLESLPHPSPAWMVYEIPLLFERDLHSQFDVTIVSWVDERTQKERLLKRDPKTTSDLADAIFKSQMSLDEKKSKAHLSFDNSAPYPSQEWDKRAQRLWDQLTGGIHRGKA